MLRLFQYSSNHLGVWLTPCLDRHKETGSKSMFSLDVLNTKQQGVSFQGGVNLASVSSKWWSCSNHLHWGKESYAFASKNKAISHKRYAGCSTGTSAALNLHEFPSSSGRYLLNIPSLPWVQRVVLTDCSTGGFSFSRDGCRNARHSICMRGDTYIPSEICLWGN